MAASVGVVFHNPAWCDGQAISPMVANRWTHSVVELLLQSEAPFSTNDVDLACARFVGWCYSRPEIDTAQMSVSNVPGWPDPPGSGASRLASRYGRVIRWLEAWDAVLVNLAALEITQSGAVLWRPEPRR
ncbi:MAG TPA: hypothetical protein VM533_07980 [Fimbriiglobus sp.]|jgi:hypothetical protein|nr:hypothetical protein [Fimbriiglobus sp.]